MNFLNRKMPQAVRDAIRDNSSGRVKYGGV